MNVYVFFSVYRNTTLDTTYQKNKHRHNQENIACFSYNPQISYGYFPDKEAANTYQQHSKKMNLIFMDLGLQFFMIFPAFLPLFHFRKFSFLILPLGYY